MKGIPASGVFACADAPILLGDTISMAGPDSGFSGEVHTDGKSFRNILPGVQKVNSGSRYKRGDTR